MRPATFAAGPFDERLRSPRRNWDISSASGVEHLAAIDHCLVDVDIPDHAADAADIQIRVAYGVENR
jgi:hypothetical protein